MYLFVKYFLFDSYYFISKKNIFHCLFLKLQTRIYEKLQTNSNLLQELQRKAKSQGHGVNQFNFESILVLFPFLR